MQILQRERRFPSTSRLCDIRYRMWIPDEIRGAIQITHGMSEHIDRYNDFAMYLAAQGFLVYGMDNISHGKSIKPDMPKGFFGTEHGWDCLIDDMHTLYELVSRDYPATAFILMGHSMGSFMARSYAARFPKDFQAYIFSGTAGKNPLAKIGRVIARREIKKGVGLEPSLKLHALGAGAYNKKYKNPRTEVEWLSRDTEIVDRYVSDSMCGFPFTPYGMVDLLTGLIEISSIKWARSVPNKPILLISGEKDPVGSCSKGVRQVEKWLKHSGHIVSCKLYSEGRHEMLNELNKDEVYDDLLLFLETILVMGEA